MVRNDAESIGSREVESRGIAIICLILRAGKSGRQKPGITDSRISAMLGNLLAVYGNNNILPKP